MKHILILIAIASGLPINVFSQYAVLDNRTASQMIENLVGENVTVLNPTMDCLPLGNATYKGEGLPGVDSGVALSYSNVKSILTGEGSVILLPYENYFYRRDEDINNIYRSWGTDTLINNFHSCKLEFDLIPNTDTVKINYVIKQGVMAGNFNVWHYQSFIRPGCRPASDLFVILVSGGTEDYNKKNFAVIPGTEIPVNYFTVKVLQADSYTWCRDGLMEDWAGVPFIEYFQDLHDVLDSASMFFNYGGIVSPLEAIIPTTPCDTYHVKLALGKAVYYMTEIDFPPGSYIPPGMTFPNTDAMTIILDPSSFYLSNLRGVGTVYECEAPAGIEMPKTSQGLQLYPNPARTSINIDLSAINTKEGTSLKIYDMLGKLVYTQALSAFSTQLEVPIGDLAPGSYELLIQTDQENFKGRFVKE